MAGPLKNLDQAARANMLLIARCERCNREAKFMAEDMARHFGRNCDPDNVKIRCKQCGELCRQINFTFMPPSSTRLTVWRPIEIKVQGER
mgnify:CR=1 FL=1